MSKNESDILMQLRRVYHNSADAPKKSRNNRATCARDRAAIATATEAFLASGGTITKVDRGMTGFLDNRGRVTNRSIIINPAKHSMIKQTLDVDTAS